MGEGKFDPAPHLIQLPGRGGKLPTDYLPVAARIAWFRAEHPDGHIVIDHIEITDQRAVFKVEASYPTEGGGRAGGQGYGSETPGDFKDYIEKASTKALGRALAALGYGTLQAGDELDEGERNVDAPQAKPTPRAGTTPGREPAPRRSAPPTDRPAAVPSAAGPPSAVTPAEEARLLGRLDKVDAHYNAPGKPTVEELEELVGADFGWTEFWSWARLRGYSDRTGLDAAVGRPTKGMTPVEIRAALRKVPVPA